MEASYGQHWAYVCPLGWEGKHFGCKIIGPCAGGRAFLSLPHAYSCSAKLTVSNHGCPPCGGWARCDRPPSIVRCPCVPTDEATNERSLPPFSASGFLSIPLPSGYTCYLLAVRPLPRGVFETRRGWWMERPRLRTPSMAVSSRREKKRLPIRWDHVSHRHNVGMAVHSIRMHASAHVPPLSEVP